MKKGIVFSMDAMYAFYIVLLLMGVLVVMLETQSNSGKTFYDLSRVARDVYELKYSGQLIPGSFGIIVNNCDDAKIIASTRALTYGDISPLGRAQVTENITTVCMP